jgi:hypothetical protein
MIRPTKRAASNQPRRRSGRVRCRDAKGVMFNFAPHSRDALTRATAVAGHAFAWILDFQIFKVGGLGRGGISEADRAI